MNDYVLDSSALLAFLQNESGAQVVAPLLSRAVINTVNFAEVVSKLADVGAQARAILDALIATSGLTVAPFDQELAYEAGLLRPVTKPYGLSLGDRACLASAHYLGVPALTAEQGWKQLPTSVGVTVHYIR